MSVIPNFSRIILFVAAAITTIHSGYGQTDGFYRLKPGEDPLMVSWRDSVYRFRQFMEGRITFIRGTSKYYKLNYSMMSGEMEFIDHKGDSLVLKSSPDLRLVSVGGRVFFHHTRAGYIELINQLPVALGVKNMLNVGRREMVGDNGYGQSTFATTSVASFYRHSRDLHSNYDILYEKTSIYFFIDKFNALHVANRASILRLFPDNREQIRAYIKMNRVNFRRERDMIELTNYCARFY